MEKIIDIYGQNKKYGEDYIRDNSWYGRILMGEDQQFEGVVEDYFGENYFLIFGQLTEDSMELTRCALEDKELPSIYEGLKIKNKIKGAFRNTDSYVKYAPLGVCQISLIPADATREETDAERENIRKKVAQMKSRLGQMGTNLEKSFNRGRNSIPQKTQK